MLYVSQLNSPNNHAVFLCLHVVYSANLPALRLKTYSIETKIHGSCPLVSNALLRLRHAYTCPF